MRLYPCSYVLRGCCDEEAYYYAYDFTLPYTAVSLPLTAAGADCNRDIERVVDNADLLSDDEEQQLSNTIFNIIDTYSLDVVILLVDDYLTEPQYNPGYYGSSYGIDSFGADYFDYNGYGCGSQYDGIILVLSMAQRDRTMVCTGFAQDAFTYQGMEGMWDRFLPYISDGDYYEGFSCFLSLIPDYVEQYNNGEAYGETNYQGDYIAPPGGGYQNGQDGYITPNGGSSAGRDSSGAYYLKAAVTAVIVGLIISFAAVGAMKKKMNTAIPQNNASKYTQEGSFKLTAQEDRFLFRTTTRIKKAEPSSSSGSGGSRGSSFTGSSGRSHTSSSGKF